MPVLRHPALLGLHYTELLGRLSLSQADVTQRLQYLACRLSMGVMENSLRQFILRRDEAYYAADCVELEERLGVLFDAGSEGCVMILRNYVDEFTNAHIRCLQAAFETRQDGASVAPPALPPAGVPRSVPPAAGVAGLRRGVRR